MSIGQLMGPRAICMFNDYRERLIASRTPLSDATARFDKEYKGSYRRR